MVRLGDWAGVSLACMCRRPCFVECERRWRRTEKWVAACRRYARRCALELLSRICAVPLSHRRASNELGCTVFQGGCATNGAHRESIHSFDGGSERIRWFSGWAVGARPALRTRQSLADHCRLLCSCVLLLLMIEAVLFFFYHCHSCVPFRAGK